VSEPITPENLAAACAGLEDYVQERAAALAKTAIAREKDRADRRIKDVRDKLLAQLTRERDLRVECQRQLKYAIRNQDRYCAEIQQLRARAQDWTTHLNAALAIVTVRQITDAEQLCALEIGETRQPHSVLCEYGVSCHSHEAHAALNRVREDLEALKTRGPELDVVTGRQP
jgi:hypothetical protein